MRILVVYWQYPGTDRLTIDEYLYSFRNYSGKKIYYLNVYCGVPYFLSRMRFDVIVYHYTYLGQKWNGREHFEEIKKKSLPLKNLNAFKIALPQDEYVNSILMCEFINEFKIDLLGTCFYEQDYEKVYPKSLTGPVKIITVLTGYVDERSLERIQTELKSHKERIFDLGYRARKVPYWLGEHGLIKWRMTDVFKNSTFGRGLNLNLSNSPDDVFYGDGWLKFLGQCRAVLGCEGGASLHDPRGEIRKIVDDYVTLNPEVSFEEVSDLFLNGKDKNIKLYAISPRHFDACITKTCQILVEGNYHGIFKPDRNCIFLKKDYSNLEEVFNKLKDIRFCEEIAENAYIDIIKSGQYTYRKFIQELLSYTVDRAESSPNNFMLELRFDIYRAISGMSEKLVLFKNKSKVKMRNSLIQIGVFDQVMTIYKWTRDICLGVRK
jgi:hypothetical protein